MSLYKNCRLCPRHCGVDRDAGQTGFCGETSALRLAFAGIHRGEEPPVTGQGGSGTVFVSGCNLGCVFCQNFQISQSGMGRVVTTVEFAEICLSLQEHGAENINIVTGSHAAPALAAGIDAARKRGLRVPVLWNSSGYEGAETLAVLKDFVDVYLPDLKTLDTEIAARFFKTQDYPECAARAIVQMMEHRQCVFTAGRGEAGEVMTSGVIIRHLVIPGFLESTRQVLRWFAENCNGRAAGGSAPGDHGGREQIQFRALLSLMTQYTPVNQGKKAADTVPARYVSEQEHDAVLSMLDEFGIDDGFCQELLTSTDWLPDFNRRNPFPSELSVPVWHWRNAGTASCDGCREPNASGSGKEERAARDS